jgi:hypothetical protein
MKRFQFVFTVTIWIIALGTFRTEIRAQVPERRIAKSRPSSAGDRLNISAGEIKEPFRVGYSYGDRDVYKIVIERPGRLSVQASWQGSATTLALILNRPGEQNAYARNDGSSPLTLEFDVTPELFSRGQEWTVSIVNFSARQSATGVVFIHYPLIGRRLSELNPEMVRRYQPLLAAGTEPGTIERKILPDGTIEIHQSDGTIEQLLSDCGRTIIYPDGKIQRALCSTQVQPNTVPELPPDSQWTGLLQNYCDGLLEAISTMLLNDQASINNYKAFEGDRALTEKIRLRIKYVNKLAGVVSVPQ